MSFSRAASALTMQRLNRVLPWRTDESYGGADQINCILHGGGRDNTCGRAGQRAKGIGGRWGEESTAFQLVYIPHSDPQTHYSNCSNGSHHQTMAQTDEETMTLVDTESKTQNHSQSRIATASLQVLLQCVAVCCSSICCSVLQCVAMCCSVLQCIAVWCSFPHSLRLHVSTSSIFPSRCTTIQTYIHT